jgi:hypothetical protein
LEDAPGHVQQQSRGPTIKDHDKHLSRMLIILQKPIFTAC